MKSVFVSDICDTELMRENASFPQEEAGIKQGTE